MDVLTELFEEGNILVIVASLHDHTKVNSKTTLENPENRIV
jgi:hypothetical protein